MGRGKSLSAKEITQIDLLLEMKWSFRQIAKKISRSHHVIENYVQKRENYGKKYVGRTSSATSPRDRRRILKESSNSAQSAKQLKEKLDVNCSVRTIQRIRQQAPHLKRKKMLRKPALKDHHKKARMSFAEKHVSWTSQWNDVVFSDEKKFNLDGPDGYSYYFHDIGKEELELMSRQHGGGSVMVWGAITSNGPIELVILNGRQSSIDYLELLKEQKEKMGNKLGRHPFIFQQDNASIHTAKIVKNWFRDENLQVLD